MPSRRETIAMTPTELSAYLAEQRRIILITNGANGLPHPVPMNYGVDEQGRIVIVTFRKSQKVKNLERDPRATLLVESGETYGELKSAILYCDTEIITDVEVIAANMVLIRASMVKRVVLRFTPFRVVSWDHGKLGGVY